MTAAKFVTSPAEGHGLTDTITSRHFAAYVKGERTDLVPAMVLLKVHGQTSRDTAQGRHSSVQYELVKCEPILDPSDRDNAMWQIQSLYEARTSTGAQRPLPLLLPNEERKQALLERIDDWATENDLTGGDLEARWRTEFGIGPDEEWSYGDGGVPSDYRKASVAYLLQFAIEVGAEPRPEGDDTGDDGEPEGEDE